MFALHHRLAARTTVLVTLAPGTLVFAAPAFAPISAQQAVTEADLAAFRPRHVGPGVTGGRIHDVEALPYDPSTLYVATASGGITRVFDLPCALNTSVHTGPWPGAPSRAQRQLGLPHLR